MSLIMNEKEFVENIYFVGFCLKNIRFYKLLSVYTITQKMVVRFSRYFV